MTKQERDNVVIDIGSYEPSIANLFDSIGIVWCNYNIFSENYSSSLYYFYPEKKTRDNVISAARLNREGQIIFIPKFLILPLFSNCKNIDDFWMVIDFFKDCLIQMNFKINHY